MKLKHFIPLSLAVVTASLLPSCDGADTIAANSPINNLDNVSDSIQSTESGDVITFTSLENQTGFLELRNLIFSGSMGQENASDTAQIYDYSKTGRFLFQLEAANDAADRLDRSLEVTLGAPSPLGTRLREILLRADPVFTAAEVQEIVGILNPSGASLLADTDNLTSILTAGRVTYDLRVTSSNRDRLAGRMRGVYELDINSFVIGFRAPSPQELDDFRFLTRDHKIPFITSTAILVDRVSAGVWVLALANGENTPL